MSDTHYQYGLGRKVLTPYGLGTIVNRDTGVLPGQEDVTNNYEVEAAMPYGGHHPRTVTPMNYWYPEHLLEGR